MKISVVTDPTGKIVGFSHVEAANAARSRVSTSLDGDAEHTVHTIELSPDLASRAHDDDFADAIFQHVVMKKGKTATLARATAPAKNAKK
jgi:hypothetical protein